jgi:hypothetical protein
MNSQGAMDAGRLKTHKPMSDQGVPDWVLTLEVSHKCHEDCHEKYNKDDNEDCHCPESPR